MRENIPIASSLDPAISDPVMFIMHSSFSNKKFSLKSLKHIKYPFASGKRLYKVAIKFIGIIKAKPANQIIDSDPLRFFF